MTALPTTDIFGAELTEGEWLTLWVTALLAVLQEMPGGAAATQLTIAGGAIVPTRSAHSVETEGGAPSDDLQSIGLANHTDGRWLSIKPANDTHAIVVKHALGGDGQIVLASGADVTLSGVGAELILRRRGTDWVEMAHNPGTVARWRSFLGLGALALAATINNANWSGADLDVVNGGTGASTPSAARSNLGLVIGTNVAAHNALVAAIGALTMAADKIIYGTGAGTVGLATLTAAARDLLDDNDAGAMLTTLGVKSMATRDVTISTGAPSGGADGDVHLRHA